MIYSLKGKVLLVDGDTVIVDVHDVGYQVLVSHVSDYGIGEEVFLYTYNVVREDEQYLVGFSSSEEKQVFLALIKVKGLGPKTVIGALSATSAQEVKDAIASNNVAYLKKLPGIGAKAASQIILDLKGKLATSNGIEKQDNKELNDALLSLGYKSVDIKKVIDKVDTSLSVENQIKEALKLLLK